jgi:hypothetical protein
MDAFSRSNSRTDGVDLRCCAHATCRFGARVSAVKFDAEGPWELEVVGFEVLGMTFGAALVDLAAYGPDGVSSMIRLEGPFELHHPGGETESFDTDSWERLAALCVLRADRIRLARITKTSELRVEFESGFTITSTSDGPYENWEMHAPGDVMVIGTPGEPAILDGDPKRSYRYKGGRWFDSDGNRIPEPELPTGRISESEAGGFTVRPQAQ